MAPGSDSSKPSTWPPAPGELLLDCLELGEGALRVQFQPQGRAGHLLCKVECKVTVWSPLVKFD